MESTINSTRLSSSEQDALRRDLCGDTDNLVSFADGTFGSKGDAANKNKVIEGDIPKTKFACAPENDGFKS